MTWPPLTASAVTLHASMILSILVAPASMVDDASILVAPRSTYGTIVFETRSKVPLVHRRLHVHSR